MAFGIDDALAAAAAAINLTDTVVETIKRCKREKKDQDLELLIEEIRITALKRIDDADLALVQFERLLTDSILTVDVTDFSRYRLPRGKALFAVTGELATEHLGNCRPNPDLGK